MKIYAWYDIRMQSGRFQCNGMTFQCCAIVVVEIDMLGEVVLYIEHFNA